MRIDVYGKPEPQGSHKSFPFQRKDGSLGVSTTDASENTKPWRESIIHAARAAMDEDFVRFSGPVEVTMYFWLPRPKNRPKTKRVLPTVKPDTDKLERAVLDALVYAGVLSDDAIVTDLGGRKRYAVGPDLPAIYDERLDRPEPGVTIYIEAMDP